MGVSVKEFGAVIEIVISGNLDDNTVSKYKITYMDYLNRGISRMVLNMSDMINMDESGIGATANLFTFIKEKEGEVVIVSGSKSVFKKLHEKMKEFSIKTFMTDFEALSYFQIDLSDIPVEDRINISEKEIGNTTVISLKNRLDVTNVVQFKNIWQDHLSKGHEKIILDFRELSFIDSSGVGSIIVLYKQLQKNQGSICVINSPDNVCRVFELAGLQGMIKIVDNIDDALRATV